MRWWNWEEFLEERSEVRDQRSEAISSPQSGEMSIEPAHTSSVSSSGSINILQRRNEDAGGTFALPKGTFEEFDRALKQLYGEYTFEFAAAESGVDARTIEEIAKLVATAGTRLSSHNWRSVTSGVRDRKSVV